MKYAQRKDYFDKRRNDMMAYLRAVRAKGKCANCGWAEHTEILQFHHKDKTKKSFNLSKGSVGCFSIKTVQSEIDKCELLCPNCHMWHHYKEIASQSGVTVSSQASYA